MDYKNPECPQCGTADNVVREMYFDGLIVWTCEKCKTCIKTEQRQQPVDIPGTFLQMTVSSDRRETPQEPKKESGKSKK